MVRKKKAKKKRQKKGGQGLRLGKQRRRKTKRMTADEATEEPGTAGGVFGRKNKEKGGEGTSVRAKRGEKGYGSLEKKNRGQEMGVFGRRKKSEGVFGKSRGKI